MPIVVLVTCWHETELPRNVTQRGRGKALDGSLTLLARTALAENQHVNMRSGTIGDPLGACGLHNLGGHAGPAQRSALHAVGGSDFGGSGRGVGVCFLDT